MRTAKNLDREGLADVILELRDARNEMVRKLEELVAQGLHFLPPKTISERGRDMAQEQQGVSTPTGVSAADLQPGAMTNDPLPNWTGPSSVGDPPQAVEPQGKRI